MLFFIGTSEEVGVAVGSVASCDKSLGKVSTLTASERRREGPHSTGDAIPRIPLVDAACLKTGNAEHAFEKVRVVQYCSSESSDLRTSSLSSWPVVAGVAVERRRTARNHRNSG